MPTKKDPCADGCPRGCSHDKNTKTFPAHTPGPWKVGQVTSQSATVETVATHHVNSMDATSGRDMSGDRTELVARVFTGPALNPGVSQANARLISSAPDLLEAAKRACSRLHEPTKTQEAFDILRAAIKKAEGR